MHKKKTIKLNKYCVGQLCFFYYVTKIKISQLSIYLFIGFGFFMWGYKWRDTKIIIQNIMINYFQNKILCEQFLNYSQNYSQMINKFFN